MRGFSRVTPQPKEHASVPNPPLASLPNLGAQSSEFYQKHPEKPQDFCLYMRDLLADSCKRKQVWACQRLVDQESNDAHQKLRRREALREALVEKCENGGDGSACHDLLRRGDVASEEEKERLRKKYDAWRLDVSCLQDKDYDECFKVFPKNPASPDEWQTQQKILQVMQTDCQEHGNPEACAWMYGFASVPGKEEFWKKQLLSNYEEKCLGQKDPSSCEALGRMFEGHAKLEYWKAKAHAARVQQCIERKNASFCDELASQEAMDKDLPTEENSVWWARAQALYKEACFEQEDTDACHELAVDRLNPIEQDRIRALFERACLVKDDVCGYLFDFSNEIGGCGFESFQRPLG